ncbi:MAG: AEC family transporter [Erysipelotrichaceae bacterium]|nr:AEC family transporter [Erysipelotrichaceae bacterium]
MNTVILSFNIIAPLIILLIIGYFLRYKGFISTKTISELNNIIYGLLLPINLFKNIYQSDFQSDFDLGLIIFCIVALLVSILVIIIITLSLIKEPSKRSAVIQASFRGNFVIFGLPLAINLYGYGISGMTSIVIAFLVPISNVCAVICLRLFNGQKIDFRHVVFDVIKNPMIIAAFIAIVLVISKINLPLFIDESVVMISDTTTALALILLGATFNFRQELNDIKMIALGVINKLILVPLLVVIVAVFLNYRNDHLVVIMTLFTAPVAVSCFPMAARMGADKEITSGIVVYSYVFCMITIFIFIIVLKSMHLI